VISEGNPADVVALHQERSDRMKREREEELARKIAAIENAAASRAS